MILETLDPQNRAIVEREMADNDKHLWCLVRWVDSELKRTRRRGRWATGPAALSDLLCQGHTVASVIWETYLNREMPKG